MFINSQLPGAERFDKWRARSEDIFGFPDKGHHSNKREGIHFGILCCVIEATLVLWTKAAAEGVGELGQIMSGLRHSGFPQIEVDFQSEN